MPRKPIFEDASACYKRIVEDAVHDMHLPWKSLRINAKFVGHLLDIDAKGVGTEGRTIVYGGHPCLALYLNELASLRCLDDGTKFDRVSITIAADARYRAALRFTSGSGKRKSTSDKGAVFIAEPLEGMPRCDVVLENDELHNTGMYMAKVPTKEGRPDSEYGFLKAPGRYAFQVIDRLKKKSYQELLALPERARLELPKRLARPDLYLFRFTWPGYRGIEVSVSASYWPDGRYKSSMSPSFEMGPRGKIYEG